MLEMLDSVSFESFTLRRGAECSSISAPVVCSNLKMTIWFDLITDDTWLNAIRYTMRVTPDIFGYGSWLKRIWKAIDYTCFLPSAVVY